MRVARWDLDRICVAVGLVRVPASGPLIAQSLLQIPVLLGSLVETYGASCSVGMKDRVSFFLFLLLLLPCDRLWFHFFLQHGSTPTSTCICEEIFESFSTNLGHFSISPSCTQLFLLFILTCHYLKKCKSFTVFFRSIFTGFCHHYHHPSRKLFQHPK